MRGFSGTMLPGVRSGKGCHFESRTRWAWTMGLGASCAFHGILFRPAPVSAAGDEIGQVND